MRQRKLLTRLSLVKPAVTILVVGLLFFAGLLFSRSLFKVKEVKIVNNNQQLIINGLTKIYQENLLFINTQSTVNYLLKLNPQINSINLKKKLPNQIILELKTAPVVAAIAADNGYLFVDNRGIIVYKKRNIDQQLPIINFYQKLYFQEYPAGKKVEFSEISYSLQCLNLINNLGLSVNTIDIFSNDMIGFNLENEKIIINTDKQLALVDYQLRAIIRQLRILGQRFTVLDLRFDKPVIKFK